MYKTIVSNLNKAKNIFTKEFISKASLLSFLPKAFRIGNPSSKKDCGQAAMTERETICGLNYDPICKCFYNSLYYKFHFRYK